MISVKRLYKKDIKLCYQLDSNTISLWSKNQWDNEFNKKGIKVFGLLFSNLLIGVCVFQVVLDEAQINYFVVKQKFRRRGFGSHLMNSLLKECEKLNVPRLLLEVSQSNNIANKFYDRFDFSTVGIRRNYYRDGSDALLKEKKLVIK